MFISILNGRLTEAKLIEKNSDGSYTLTSYGRVVLLLLSSYTFVSKDYFLSHDISFLPRIYRKDWRVICVRVFSKC